MECAFDAQNLISISLRKIQSSRTQRGGIKLHKNLLVTYVLRNARQLELSGSFTELSDDFYCNFGGGVESDTWHCGAHQPSGANPAEVMVAHQDAPAAAACVMVAPSDPSGIVDISDGCWSCGAEKSSLWDLPMANTQANQKTVLDLDTHVVTTVTSGYFHSDCCAPPPPKQAQCAQLGFSKKRKIDTTSYHFVDPELYLPDLGPLPCKTIRTDEDFQSDSEQFDTTSISNIISVLGSGGLSEFMSWQHTDLEQIFTTQTICLKQKLLSGSGWTRAIEAF